MGNMWNAGITPTTSAWRADTLFTTPIPLKWIPERIERSFPECKSGVFPLDDGPIKKTEKDYLLFEGKHEYHDLV